MNSSLSRRHLMKATAATAAATTLGLSWKGGTAARPGWAPAQISRLSQSSGMNVVLAIQSFAHEALQPVVDAWGTETGNTVTLESGPVTGQEMITKYAPAFQAGSSPVDVFSDADESSPVFMRAGWVEPLDEAIPQETWDDFPASFDQQIEVWHSYEGARYRVPHEFAIGYTFYRKDWFDERSMVPPATWEEMVSMGTEFTADPVWGTMEAMIKPGLMYVYMAYLTSQTGGSIFEFDDATAEAFQFAYDLIYTHKIMPETALSSDYTMQNEEYMSDRVAFMRQWPFFWDVARGDADRYQEGMAEIALPPAGPAGALSWWGGWGFSVPAFAPNKEAALDLLAYITAPAQAAVLAQGQSFFATPRASILEALGENGIAPSMKLYADNNVPAPRPFHEKIAEAQSVVDDVGSLFLTKQATLEEAMQTGKDRIASL